MRDIKKHIEQLEEAASQLDKRTPTGARLALLLLDNVIELLMYDKIIVSSEDYLLPIKPPMYRSKRIKDTTKEFTSMVTFLVEPKREIDFGIDFDEGEVLKVGHIFRNEAYHNGIIRDPIILDIALHYFEVVCRLFPRLWIGEYGASTSDWSEEHAFLRLYGIQSNIINQDVLSKVCDHLLKGRTSSVHELRESLSQDLLSRIEDLFSGLNDLAASPSTIDDLIKAMLFYENLRFEHVFPDMKESQLYEMWGTEKSEYDREYMVIAEIQDSEKRTKERKKLDEEHKYREMQKMIIKYVREQLPIYQPKIKKIRINSKTIETWKRQAKKIESQTMPGRVMRDFHKIDRLLREMENTVGEAFIKREEMQGY